MFLLVMNYSSPTIAITMLIVFYIIVNYKELFTTLKDILETNLGHFVKSNPAIEPSD